MANALLLNLSALMALVPASILSYRRTAGRPDLVFWALLLVALTGPVAVTLVLLSGAWQTGLSAALWISIAVSMALFVFLSLISREAWRLTPLLVPYLLLLGVLATVWSNAPARHAQAVPDVWLNVHIALSVLTYGLCTLAAVAAAAAFLQERALKRKAPTELTHKLPSVADAAGLQFRLLGAGEVVLACGIASGMARNYLANGHLLQFDHKTLLSLLAFAVIGVLLVVHRRTGLRGQRAARFILLAYLLLTLAYPGVKFVTDVLIG